MNRTIKSQRRANVFIAKLVLIALVIGAFSIFPIVYRSSAHSVTFTVESKERVAGNESSVYLVFTNRGVFEVSDTISFFNWSSSDRYAALKPGKTYQVQVAGWRVPFLSMYPNVLRVSPVS